MLKFFRNFYCIYIGIVFVLSICLLPVLGFTLRRNYAGDNPYILIVVIVLAVLFLCLILLIKRKKPDLWQKLNSDKFFTILLVVGSIVLILLQYFVIKGGWIICGFDTRDVIFPEKQIHSDYMSMYPNQLFLAGIFRRIYLLTTQNFGFSFDEYYFTLVVLSTLAVWISVILISLISKKITNNFCACVTFLFAAGFLGLSPWIMVPYSDTFSMLCTTFTLFCYTNIKFKPARWFLIFLASIIGYLIKPTAIFILLAILFVEICKLVWKVYLKLKNKELLAKIKTIVSGKKNKIALTCVSIAFAFLGIGFAAFIGNQVSNYDIEINPDRQFTPTHFLMMGINWKNTGGWNNDDVELSRSFPNVEQREAGNIKEWQRRLNEYGPIWMSWIFINKTLTNYGDGSFAWEAETPWCIENRGHNPIVWFIYGIDPADAHDDNNNFSAYIRQVFWLTTLIGCFLIIFNKKPSRAEYVMCCTLLAISAFLTLFEPDPRYLLLYLPYMIILAPWGWELATRTFFQGQSQKC